MGTKIKAQPQFKLSEKNVEKIEQTVNRALALASAAGGKYVGERVSVCVEKDGSMLWISKRPIRDTVFAGYLSKDTPVGSSNIFELMHLSLGFSGASVEIDNEFKKMQAEAAKKLERKS